MTAPRLEFRNVTKRFANPDGDATTAIAGVTFSVADGEVVSLIGPSGCGKSTLLNLGSGLDQPSAAPIELVHNIEQVLGEFVRRHARQQRTADAQVDVGTLLVGNQ